jgi:hypothetical protein
MPHDVYMQLLTAMATPSHLGFFQYNTVQDATGWQQVCASAVNASHYTSHMNALQMPCTWFGLKHSAHMSLPGALPLNSRHISACFAPRFR